METKRKAMVIVLIATLLVCFALVERAAYVLINDEKAERLCGWAGSLIPLGIAISSLVYRMLN